MAHRIRITKAQAEAVEWALGAMGEYWRDHEAEGITENEFPEGVPATWTLPRVEGDHLILSNWDEINDDLAYRVGEQLAQMVESNTVETDLSGRPYHEGDFFSPQKGRALVRSYKALAQTIRDAMAMEPCA